MKRIDDDHISMTNREAINLTKLMDSTDIALDRLYAYAKVVLQEPDPAHLRAIRRLQKRMKNRRMHIHKVWKSFIKEKHG
jgi:hypothetical protein